MSAPIPFRISALRTGLESTYGARPAVDATDAVLYTSASVKPVFETAERGVIKPYFGADEVLPVGTRMDIELALELQSSGAQGTAPPIAEYLLCAGHAETVVAAGSAGLTQTSPATSVGTVTGAWTYAKTAAPVVTLPRTVTLECTTAGGSGVAAFTVSAPAVGAHTAYSATGVVMTNASAFALCNSCTITPTITTSFAEGDTFTIKLMPPHVYYTPISDGMSSNGGLMHFNGRSHDFSGARYNAEFTLSPKTLPSIKFTGIGLYGGVTAETSAPDTSFDRWKTPAAVNADNTTAASIHGLTLPMSEFAFNAGMEIVDSNLPGQHFVSVRNRAAKNCSVQVQSPPFAEWDYHTTVEQVTLGGLSWAHGTDPGYIVAFESAVGQLSEPQEVDVAGDIHVKFRAALIPGAAGNDYKILFY